MKKIATLVISLFLPIFTLAAAPALAVTPDIAGGLCAGANLQLTDNPSGNDCSNGGDATAKINQLIHTIINWLSIIIAVVAVIMIMIGGFRYITSGGNDTSVTSAKNTILYAIIGLVVVALAQLIVKFTLSKASG